MKLTNGVGGFKRFARGWAPLPRGSEAYLDLLPDLDVELDTLRLKAQHALEALEEFEDSLAESE